MVERGSGIAVWRQIGQLLAQDIRTRRYVPGEQLPAESELAARHAVNRHTLRRAMAELERQGLVRIEQGRGTFVQEHAVDYAIGRRTRFSENLRRQGLSGHVQLLAHELLRDGPVARHLGLARNARLLHVCLAGRSGGRVLSVSEHYFSAARFPDMADRLAALQSVSRAYAHYGIADYTRQWSRITAVLPDAHWARILCQSKTRPVLQVEALDADQHGKPLQYGITRFAGDGVQLVIASEEP